MITIILFIAVCYLAYSNGANDNFKGAATLYGSGTTNYKMAIHWGTLWTFLGSVCSLLLAQSLLKAFSGKGLVPLEVVESEYFLTAVALGAGTTVLIATLTGMPISTTHSIVGALVGAGLVATSGNVNHQMILKTYFMPLLLSPLVALCSGAILYSICHFVRFHLRISKELCICIGNELRVPAIPLSESLFAVDVSQPQLGVAMDEDSQCEQRYVGRFLGVRLQQIVDGFHFISAGLVSFARGLNDTPKITALLLVAQAINIQWGIAMVAITMAAGGLINARMVAETMGHRITEMNHGQAVSANIATGLLVIVASRFGLPVSTTHVSVGSLFGIGLVTRSAHYRSIATILLAWLFTLPCAGAIAAISYFIIHYV